MSGGRSDPLYLNLRSPKMAWVLVKWEELRRAEKSREELKSWEEVRRASVKSWEEPRRVEKRRNVKERKIEWHSVDDRRWVVHSLRDSARMCDHWSTTRALLQEHIFPSKPHVEKPPIPEALLRYSMKMEFWRAPVLEPCPSLSPRIPRLHGCKLTFEGILTLGRFCLGCCPRPNFDHPWELILFHTAGHAACSCTPFSASTGRQYDTTVKTQAEWWKNILSRY